MLRPAAALAAAVLLCGCAALVEPLEQSLLYRSRPAGPERFAAILERDSGVEEVRIATADGVQLHGLLKRARGATPGSRYPLVIVFGGVARETSWMVNWGDKPTEWGWLLVNYRGYGLSQGTPNERTILADSKRLVDRHHQRGEDAMVQIALAHAAGVESLEQRWPHALQVVARAAARGAAARGASALGAAAP